MAANKHDDQDLEGDWVDGEVTGQNESGLAGW